MLVVFQAFVIGTALIIAIGAQNVFIIKEGLRGGYVYTAALVSAACDAVLIAVGIVLVSQISREVEWFENLMIFGAVLFLIFYSATSFLNAFREKPSGWAEAEASQHDYFVNRRKTIKFALMFSLLSPHVYLDTIVVLGSLGAAQQGFHQALFWLGGALASFVWFMGTGHLAVKLAPLLRSERTGRVIDGIVGIVVLLLAGQLGLRLL